MTKKEKETLRKLIVRTENVSAWAMDHIVNADESEQKSLRQWVAKAFTELYKFAGVE